MVVVGLNIRIINICIEYKSLVPTYCPVCCCWGLVVVQTVAGEQAQLAVNQEGLGDRGKVLAAVAVAVHLAGQQVVVADH